ncbi:flagellar assembly protein FliW [bacterium]|nr:flagellar assembly protein FliW [bacterium]
MEYTVKQAIPGFENVKKVLIEKGDGATCLLRSLDDKHYMQIALAYAQPNAKVDVSDEIQALLQLKDDSKCSIYYPVIIDQDVEKSVINLSAPFLFNEDNKTVAQCISINE